MASELRPVDVSDKPEVLHLAQDVADTGIGRVLRTARGEIAIIIPVEQHRRGRGRGRPITSDDSLYALIGAGRSESESDASERKHDVLARAYRPRE